MAGTVLMTGIIELIPSMAGSKAAVTKDLTGIDTGPVGANLGDKMGRGMAAPIKKLVGAAVAGLAAVEIKQFATGAVSAFSELEDSTAAAGVVFGDSMGIIVNQSKTASKQLGLSSQQVINAANTYGTYGKAAGLSGDALANFSSDFTTLAGDMASFKGTSTEQAIEAVGAALRGETEPIRAYGVMLDDASMRQKALELGIISTTKDALTPQQKILAAQALIYEQTGDAQGDFARTSESTANIAKTLSAETENLSAKFGQVLAPAFTFVRVKALDAVRGVSGLLDKVLAFQDGLGSGALTPDLVRTLGLDPGNGFGLVLNEAIGGLRAFGAAWKYNDGEITSVGFPGFMEAAAYKVRGALDSMKEGIGLFAAGFSMDETVKNEIGAPLEGLVDLGYRVGAVFRGDMGEVRPLFESVMAVAKPAGPIILEVGRAFGTMAGEIGTLLGSGVKLLGPLLEGAASVMTYLSEHTGVLTAVIIGLAAGYAAVKLAVVAATAADLLRVPLLLVQATANRELAGAIRAQTAAQGTNTGVTTAAIAPEVSLTLAERAHAAAARGLAIANGLASASLTVLKFALKALPFVGIAVLIAGLVTGLVAFFTKTEAGQAIIGAVWGFIKGAIAGVVDWWTGTAQPAIAGGVEAVGTVFSWLNTNVVQPVVAGVQVALGWLKDAFTSIWTTVEPVFSGIGTVLNGFWLLARGIFQVVVSLIVNVLAPAFVNLWNGVISPVFSWIGDKIGEFWGVAQVIFGAVVGFVRDVLGTAFSWFKDHIIMPVFSFIGAYIGAWWTLASGIFNAVVGFVQGTLGPVFSWLWDHVISPVFGWIGDKISTVWNNTLKPVFDFFAAAIRDDLPKAFEKGKEIIGDIWDGIKDVAKAPVKFVVETVLNNGLIKGFNVIAGILPDVDKLPNIALPEGFARGGIIPGYNAQKKDDVLTPMRSGEGVLVPEAVRAVGSDFINGVNSAANSGGVAGARKAVNGAYAANGQGNMGGYFMGNAGMIGSHGALYLDVASGMAPWNFPGAASMWDGAAGVKVKVGRGQHQASVRPLERGGGILGYSQNTNIDMSPSWMQNLGAAQRQTVAAHEIGHSLGLPHNSGNSIMQPNLANMAKGPTALDISNLQTLYPGGTGKAGSGFFENPLKGMVDKMVGLFKEKFASAGIFGELVMGVGKFIISKVQSWVEGIIPGGDDEGGAARSGRVSPTVYDGGGWLHNTGGAQIIQHNKSKPDAVLENGEFKDLHRAARWVAEREQNGDAGGAPVEVKVYGAPGQDENVLSELVVRKINRRRGRRR